MHRLLFLLLLTALLTGSAACAWAGAPLELGTQTDIEAWPVVELLGDPKRELNATSALASASWERPRSPQASLGAPPGGVWLRAPLSARAEGSGIWILEIDYPVLDDIQVWQVDDGRPRLAGPLGDRLAYAERAFPARSHAQPLKLPRGPSDCCCAPKPRVRCSFR